MSMLLALGEMFAIVPGLAGRVMLVIGVAVGRPGSDSAALGLDSGIASAALGLESEG